MNNYKLDNDESILMESNVSIENIKDNIHLILTSKKLILEQTTIKGIFKQKEDKNLIDSIPLKNVKIYNNKIQASQKKEKVVIQTIDKNINICFNGMIEAMKFVTKINDAITETTMTQRGVNKVKGAIDTVDDVLGLDTRGTVKGVLENGIAGTIFKGIGKKK